MQRQGALFIRSLLLALLFGTSQACTPVHLMSELERNQLKEFSPTPQQIAEWGQSAFPSNVYKAAIFGPAFEACTQGLVSKFQAGEQFILKRPSVSPTYGGAPEIDQEFGLPISEVGDSLTIAENVEIHATIHVLRWYASKGLYPTNSVKHTCPK